MNMPISKIRLLNKTFMPNIVSNQKTNMQSNLLFPTLLQGLKWSLFFSILFFSSCEERSYIYDVNDVLVTANDANKDKEKTTEQYIAILYSNIFQKALSPNQLVDASEIVRSIGDKKIAYEVIIAKFLNHPDAVLPSNSTMRNNIEQFVIDTYERFFVRTPTEAEKLFFINFIETRNNITPEHVYTAFATSNEYAHY